MNKEIVIQTRGLSKQFDQITALKDLDLKVPKNTIFGFLGPNGAGKTTAIKLLLGLLKPSTGGGSVFGHDIIHESLEIRSRTGYLPQDPRFYEHMSAREVLRFTLHFYFQGPEKEIEGRIEETLAMVSLADKADRPIKGFSGGERQRLGIAQAQINYPDLLILDEPAASLDPLGRHDVLQIMAKLRQHTTIFYSTHILGDVQKVSDSVAILNKGQLVAQGPIESLLAGGDGTVYNIQLKQLPEHFLSQIKSLPYVREITEMPLQDGHVTWHVAVNDDQAAESLLLRDILVDQVIVSAFQKRRFELEDVFLSIVEGDDHGRK